MTPKELLFSALRHEVTPRTAWVPFAGVHAGEIFGADAAEVLSDENTLVKALLEVNRLYKPDGQPVVFDLQLEAEILGCDLIWSKDCPPSVTSHPLAETAAVANRRLQPWLMSPDALPAEVVAGSEPPSPAVSNTMRDWARRAGWDEVATALQRTPLLLEQVRLHPRLP